jgi:chromosome segregation ATPase
MSFLFVLLALSGCTISAFGGAWFARWRMRRAEVVAESEDIRDTQIRELLAEVKVLGKAAKGAEAAGAEAAEKIAALEAQIDDLRCRLDAAQKTADNSEKLLRDEVDEKARLREDLIRARREKDALETRTQELELELRMASDGSQLLDPALQMESS